MAGMTAPQIVRETWGARVREARRQAELSQVALAERVGRDQSVISRVETGDYGALSVDLVLDLCVVLGLEPNEAFRWPTAIVDIARSKQGAAA